MPSRINKVKAIENLLTPFKETLSKNTEQIRNIEKECTESYGTFIREIEAIDDHERLKEFLRHTENVKQRKNLAN